MDELKTKRRTAKSQFTRNGNTLQSMVDGNRPSREITEQLEKFKIAYGVLVSIHDEYCSHIADDNEYSVQEKWIEEAVDCANKITAKTNDYLNRDSKVERPSELQGIMVRRSAGGTTRGGVAISDG
jgi:hypothetical protein